MKQEDVNWLEFREVQRMGFREQGAAVQNLALEHWLRNRLALVTYVDVCFLTELTGVMREGDRTG